MNFWKSVFIIVLFLLRVSDAPTNLYIIIIIIQTLLHFHIYLEYKYFLILLKLKAIYTATAFPTCSMNLLPH